MTLHKYQPNYNKTVSEEEPNHTTESFTEAAVRYSHRIVTNCAKWAQIKV